MYKILALAAINCLASCSGNTSSAKKTNSSAATKIAVSTPKTDSTIFPFRDKSYKLTLHIFDPDNDDQGKSNAVLTFQHSQGSDTKIIFHDSLYCMRRDIDMKDFNNDKVKDVLVFNYTGARANETYHLYLADTVNHKLIYVNGFQNLPNPDLDTANNIITSIALSGKDYYSFYRINHHNKLIDLGHGFETDEKDTTKYDKAVAAILHRSKR